jgi:hypothetical protein
LSSASRPWAAVARKSFVLREFGRNGANMHRSVRANMNLHWNIFNALQCFGLESLVYFFAPESWYASDR